MKLTVDKIILLVDIEGGECYNKITYTSTVDKEIDISFGPPKTIIDSAAWNFHDFNTINEPLFSADRIIPLSFFDLTEKTLVGIMLRSNHFLINTTFSQNILYKDFTFIPKYNSLLYLFGFVPQKLLIINPTLIFDHQGIISELKSNLTNNNLRARILELMKFETVPNKYLSKHLETARDTIEEFHADIIINQEENRFKIIFKNTLYDIQNSTPLLEALTILRNNLHTNKPQLINKFWNTVRINIKNNCNRFNTKSNDPTDHFESILKNFNRLIKEFKEYESNHNIEFKDGFAKFLGDTIKISRGDYSISCFFPSNISIEFNSTSVPIIKE